VVVEGVDMEGDQIEEGVPSMTDVSSATAPVTWLVTVRLRTAAEEEEGEETTIVLDVTGSVTDLMIVAMVAVVTIVVVLVKLYALRR